MVGFAVTAWIGGRVAGTCATTTGCFVGLLVTFAVGALVVNGGRVAGVGSTGPAGGR